VEQDRPLDAEARAQLENVAERRARDRPVLASALTGEGLDRLLGRIEARLRAGASCSTWCSIRPTARGELAAPPFRGDGQGDARRRPARHDGAGGCDQRRADPGAVPAAS
jgi:hypothetical protein